MRRKILIALVGVPALLLLAALLYLKFGNLGWLQGSVERRLGEALGRELSIDGDFEIEVLPSVRIAAEQVHLANPAWSDEPDMVRVDRLQVAVGLRSLLGGGPTRVRDLRIEGARVRLERDAEGRANWNIGAPRQPGPTPGLDPREQQVSFGSIALDDIELTYRDPSRERPLRFVVDSAEAGPSEEQMIALKLDGTLDRFPVALTGRVTSLDGLFAGEPLRHDLRGRIGRIDITVQGEVADPATLRGPDITLRLEGPDLEAVTDLLDLPSLGSGAFGLDGRIRPAPEGIELALDADLVELQVEVRGHADRLIDPGKTDLDIRASGTNLNAAGALFGQDGWPTGEFEASAGLSSDGARVTLEQVRARVGEHRASVEGVIRTSADIVDRELRFEIEGPDLSAFSAAAGAELARRPYRLTGHFRRDAEDIVVESLVGRVGDVDVHATGTLDEVFRFSGARLHVRTSGPDLSAIRLLSDLTLPTGEFSLAGNVQTADGVVVIDRAAGRAGDTRVSFDGTVVLGEDYAGTKLSARASGTDPEWITSLFGLEKLPHEPYDVVGRIRFTETGTKLDSISGTYDDLEFDLSGRPGDLVVRLSGPDVSRLEAFGGPEDLPVESFEFDGRVRALELGYELENCRGALGSLAFELDGRLGELPDVEGSDIRFAAHGPDLSALAAYAELPPLPGEDFTVAGRWGEASGVHRLEAVSGELGRHRFAVDGRVVPSAERVGTVLTLEVSGPDLADAGRVAAGFGFDELPPLPDLPYSVAGDVRVEGSGYAVPRVLARIGEAEARVAGFLGRLPDGFGTSLSVEAQGPDASVISGFGGVSLPPRPFTLGGRVERDRVGARFHDVVADLGGHRAEIDGTLGEPPRLEGTNLDVRLSGPDPSLIAGFVDLPPLPQEPFELSAHLDGSPTRFHVQGLDARFGRSDLSGELSIDLERDKPLLEGELVSERFDLAQLLEDDLAGPQPEPAGDDEALLISDEPLPLDWLDAIDARVRWRIGEAIDSRAALGNVELSATLLDGRLALDPVAAQGYGGSYSGALTLEPVEDGYLVTAAGTAERARMGLLTYGGDPSEIPPVDLQLKLVGTGHSLHEMAASADGSLLVVQAAGRIDNSLMTRLAADPFSKLYTALNPFTKNEPYTTLECSVTAVEMQDGVARIEPLALRSDKMVILAKGQIDFETERLRVDWATKPRKGVGLSAGSIANQYVRLGGTLSKPAITVSPLKAAGEAGATVMTGGLWLLYKSVFNRVTAERKVCELALKRIRKKEKRGR
jgi:uncharacterized protein involved in outer membrane biogenesis